MNGVERGLERKVDGRSCGIKFQRALLRKYWNCKLQREQSDRSGQPMAQVSPHR